MSTDRPSLKQTLASIEKDLGASVQMLGDMEAVKVEAIRSGSFLLDAAIGVGGYPRGRIIEIFGAPSGGKTTMSLSAIAQAQKAGGRAAFIDVEHAFSVEYAQSMGIDTDKLYFVQPDFGEQALEILERLTATNEYDIIVLDSTAALLPKAEMEEEVGKQFMALQARMMSQALRKLTPVVGKTKTVVIFINQTRQNVGVMYGCFDYRTEVALADGTTEKIGKIVNDKLKVNVLAYNANTGEIESKPVVNWFNNGRNEENWLQFSVVGGQSGRRGFRCTANHQILTPEGEVSAGDLAAGDLVLSTMRTTNLTQDQRELVIGSLLGDGHLNKKAEFTSFFVEDHALSQKAYLSWKKKMLANLSSPLEKMGAGIGFRTKSTIELGDLHDKFYKNKRKTLIDSDILNQLTLRSVAVWYQDDGTYRKALSQKGRGVSTIYNTEFDTATRERVSDRLEALGVGRPTLFKYGFRFTAEQTDKLHAAIADFVHPNLAYKLHPKYRGKFQWKPSPSKARDRYVTMPTRILSIKKEKVEKAPFKYDLEIEGNHTYLVGGQKGGVVVHNSPTTTPGGEALKFYSSVRLNVRRVGGSDIKDGKEILGHVINITCVKNKVAPPLKSAELTFIYGKGIDTAKDMIEYALSKNILTVEGHTYSLGDLKWVGREKAVTAILEDPVLTKKVEDMLLGVK